MISTAVLARAFIAYVFEHVRPHKHAVLFVLGETAVCPWGKGWRERGAGG